MTVYGHLSTTMVYTGQHVYQGQVIGFVGSTGHSTGAHLHFETRLNGVKYNPMTEYQS
jgi:murein DD-endopeptidase MepM/ murein hydrolase activator NlpD